MVCHAAVGRRVLPDPSATAAIVRRSHRAIPPVVPPPLVVRHSHCAIPPVEPAPLAVHHSNRAGCSGAPAITVPSPHAARRVRRRPLR